MIFGYHSVGHSQTDLKELKTLVRQGEGLNIEFKLKSNHPEKIIREVVAFANSNGGKLLIGVSDDKLIKGLKYAEEDEYVITRNIEKYIYPAIDYTIKRIRVEEDRDVLVYHIKASPFKPHYVDLDGHPENRKAYIRIEDKSIQASREMREILKGQRKEKNLRFTFGEKEKTLFQYLDIHQHITVNTFARIANIPLKLASRTLVLLVLTQVLKVLPNEMEDLYMAVQPHT